MHPVPGRTSTTFQYGQRGKMWSCLANSAGGIHTGIDFMAPRGTPAYAARPGVAKHVNFGLALGRHQLAVYVSDGTLDFYAHMGTRIGHNVTVAAGAKVGTISDEGNANGCHLHFERHKNQQGWRCGNHADPLLSVNWKPANSPSEDDMTPAQAKQLTDLAALLAAMAKANTDRYTVSTARYQDLVKRLDRLEKKG